MKPSITAVLPSLQHQKTPKALAGLAAAINFLLPAQAFGRAYGPMGIDFTSYLLSRETLLPGAKPYQRETVFPFIYPVFSGTALMFSQAYSSTPVISQP
ncbi:hypothetical protein [Nafulsella turpanensis]|uniref:hypothetical protein n=1 Tax=Nafulsella turpanensis TaxID=1265690 RepID=UPI0003496D40|nr:hypothetical protein [Nafulsella turpanensis]